MGLLVLVLATLRWFTVVLNGFDMTVLNLVCLFRAIYLCFIPTSTFLQIHKVEQNVFQINKQGCFLSDLERTLPPINLGFFSKSQCKLFIFLQPHSFQQTVQEINSWCHVLKVSVGRRNRLFFKDQTDKSFKETTVS